MASGAKEEWVTGKKGKDELQTSWGRRKEEPKQGHRGDGSESVEEDEINTLRADLDCRVI